ncbi:hypothetical protein K8Q98_02950 [Candidatus Nomurabacteria bacterium]|nr:hypothetical protein [Candidatus Nomurabacteria bacterium]
MDINDLNKSQLILLAILLSFITSIATGITTVTLMEQAPDSVTVPINRVIKQTVEKIQQVEGKTTIETVVIKEEDLVVDAIAKNKSAVFILTKEIRNENNDLVEVSAGRSFAVSDKNIIVADALFVQGKGTYFAQNDSGKFRAEFLSTDSRGFSFLKVDKAVDEQSVLTYTLPVFGDLSKMKIGQKILVLGNNISSMIFEGDKNLKINATLSNAGGIVLNLEGEVLGMALFNETNSFAPISVISESLAQVTE